MGRNCMEGGNKTFLEPNTPGKGDTIRLVGLSGG
jgi:hypothetical protein